MKKSFLFLLFNFSFMGIIIAQQTTPPPNTKNIQVAVWDTYVTKKDGSVMHFDIIAPATVKDTNVIYGYGREYLKSKGQAGQPLTSKQCRFCHVRTIFPQWEADIARQGYYIIELEGCK